MAEHFAVTLLKAIFRGAKAAHESNKRIEARRQRGELPADESIASRMSRGAGAGMTAAAKKSLPK